MPAPAARAPLPAAAPAPDPRVNLLDLEPAEAERVLREWLAAAGEPAYRAAQIVPRLWQRPAASFDAIRELPAPLRARLGAAFRLPRLALAAHQRSGDGTQKFLFRLDDGQAIETVAIPDGDRLTFCISSQAGCALACAFCATGAMGFQRNLTPAEIAGQVRELALLDAPLRATNIVFMGMGEPLMNWKAVSPTLTILNDPRGSGSARGTSP
jgi:23S rRNA (adenine2503-C2)-methyltransferase